MRAIDTNPYLESVRAAYRNSSAYKTLHGITKQPTETDKREERQALGIPLDDFERELGERANP